MKVSVSWTLPLMMLSIWTQSPAPCTARNVPMEKYAVVFDAGSTGTRCKVFQVSLRNGPLLVSDVKQLSVPKPNKVKPGLSSFGGNPEGVGPQLVQLIESAKKVVPTQHRAQTPALLYATGGMRLLPEIQRKQVMGTVDKTLSDSTKCPFMYHNGSAKVISGVEEAIYSWIAVNFLLGEFSGENGEVYGTIEIGGASSQNSFDINGRKTISATKVLNLGKKKYSIHAHSHLGYGGDEARKTLREHLLNETLRVNSTAREIVNPCFNSNFNRTVDINNGSYLMQGKYNEMQCTETLRKVFFPANGPYKDQPSLRGKFYGLSLYYYVFKAVGILSSGEDKVNMSKVASTTKSFCSKQLSTDELNDEYSRLRCFDLNYINTMLKYGYDTKPDSFELHAAEEINGIELTWTLGAMLSSEKLLEVSGGGTTSAAGLGHSFGLVLLILSVLLVTFQENI